MQLEKILLHFLLLATPALLPAQEIAEAKTTINYLCSKKLQGRGYAFGGDKKAASYIAEELQKAGILPLGKSYKQEFSIQINTLPEAKPVKLNDFRLQAGVDYLIASHSGSVEGKFPISILNAEIINDSARLSQFAKQDFSKKALLIDTSGVVIKNFERKYQFLVSQNILQARVIILPTSAPLIYVPSQYQTPFATLFIKKELLSASIPRFVEVDVKAKFLKNYTTANVLGVIPGHSDSCIFLSAHYDHIGLMGADTYFPGANDNAGGVAMVLDLAKQYARKGKPKYTMIFAFFSGEELGLLGSKFYTESPLLPLSRIKLLVNLDMVGSGDEGITVVNGAVFKKEFDLLKKLNDEKKYLPEIKMRGAAANSDHYFFYEKGVKSFFIYTRGVYKEYHNIFDRAEDLPLTEFVDLQELLKSWIDAI